MSNHHAPPQALERVAGEYGVSVYVKNSRSGKPGSKGDGKKHFIDPADLEAKLAAPRKRSRADDVETRVAKARSLCVSEVDARAHELIEEPFRDFLAKKIDGAEIERRREAAREQAAKEHPTLSALDKAFAAYTAAAAAEQPAAAKREAAEATLEAALRALEIKGEAGPSGVKAEA